MRNKLVKRDLPALPTMFGNLTPVDMPDVDFSRGLIPNYFQKRRLKQSSEMQKYKAEAAEAQAREVAANANRMMEAMMFGPRFRDAMDELDSKKQMRRLDVMLKQEQLREQMLKNVILDMECKDLKATNTIKWKDMDYDPADEDR